MSITLRPVVAADDDFLFIVYASTRRDEVAAFGWDISQQDAFLKMQCAAQQRSFEMNGDGVSHQIILLDDKPVGRILVVRTTEEIRLVDIALLPANQGHGIGTALIKELLDDGDRDGLPVRLMVLKGNRAALLYDRLGFIRTGDNGVHIQMERKSSELLL